MSVNCAVWEYSDFHYSQFYDSVTSTDSSNLVEKNVIDFGVSKGSASGSLRDIVILLPIMMQAMELPNNTKEVLSNGTSALIAPTTSDLALHTKGKTRILLAKRHWDIAFLVLV